MSGRGANRLVDPRLFPRPTEMKSATRGSGWFVKSLTQDPSGRYRRLLTREDRVQARHGAGFRYLLSFVIVVVSLQHNPPSVELPETMFKFRGRDKVADGEMDLLNSRPRRGATLAEPSDTNTCLLSRQQMTCRDGAHLDRATTPRHKSANRRYRRAIPPLFPRSRTCVRCV